MRRTARENAFKLIFEELVLGYENQVTYLSMANSEKKFDTDYMDEILRLSREKKDFIVSVVSRFAKGYSLDRIYRIDLAILTVAICEVLFCETPDKVAVNEAVELAKKYGGADDASFVNGVLGTLARA